MVSGTYADNSQSLPKQICQARKNFWTTQVLETVLRQIDLHETQWLDKAEKLCTKWSKYNSAGFLAFLRHEGSWKTAKCPRADWNQDLLELAEVHLRPALDNLCDNGAKLLQEEMTQHVVDLLEQMGSDVRACLDSNQHGAFREFFENMQKYGKDVEVTLKLACKKFGSEAQ
jgi:hypothetical protein